MLTAVQTTVVDFTVTQKGLEEQLLGGVIQKEQKSLEEQLNNVLEEVRRGVLNEAPSLRPFIVIPIPVCRSHDEKPVMTTDSDGGFTSSKRLDRTVFAPCLLCSRLQE